MSNDQQHLKPTTSSENPIIDDIPEVTLIEADAKSNENTVSKPAADKQNRTSQVLSKDVTPKIDTSSGPALVTPIKMLQKDAAWIDCLFCERMAQTKVTLQKESEEPSGLMMCLVCLVCCPLLLCLPAMMGTTSSWKHYCSSCNNLVAIRWDTGKIEVKEPQPSKLVPSKFGAANQAAKVETSAPAKVK